MQQIIVFQGPWHTALPAGPTGRHWLLFFASMITNYYLPPNLNPMFCLASGLQERIRALIVRADFMPCSLTGATLEVCPLHLHPVLGLVAAAVCVPPWQNAINIYPEVSTQTLAVSQTAC
jgi:hypothetical protein